jgi:hypothetical protein
MKYIIVDKHRGVFLGSYSVPLSKNENELANELYVDKGKYRIYMFYACTNPFMTAHVPTFNSITEVNEYIENYMFDENMHRAEPAPIDASEEYATLVEVIKSGYESYTYDMLMNLKPHNNTVH